jgi:hypothetical protein
VIDGPSRCYRFFGNQTLEFERNLVLNHRLKMTQRFSAGESAEGFLLGLGSEPIPEEHPHGKMIPAFVFIYDQFARMCRVPVKLGRSKHEKYPVKAIGCTQERTTLR